MYAVDAGEIGCRGRLGVGFLLTSVALQNLGRREARTLLLLAAVAICSGAVFTGAVLMRSIESSMTVGFTRLGADMLVVPSGALTNITAALLTAEPTDLTLDDSVLASLEATLYQRFCWLTHGGLNEAAIAAEAEASG
jgi:putative ABC transport system permease protein